MATQEESSPTPSRGSGRGRGKRGGYGKAMRARGKGSYRGRAAEFTTRLVLDDEQPLTEEEQEEAARELREKFAKRELGTNADRYEEVEGLFVFRSGMLGDEN